MLAGILIGLGTATKLYPVLIFGAILLLALRTGQIRAFLVTAGAATRCLAGRQRPIALTEPLRLEVLLPVHAGPPGRLQLPLVRLQPAWPDALRWNGPGRRGHQRPGPEPLPAGLRTASRSLALTAPRRPRLAQLAFLIVAAFILTNKVYSPQFVIWLIPLLALARPRWRDFLSGRASKDCTGPPSGCTWAGDQRGLVPAQHRYALLRPGRGCPYARNGISDGPRRLGHLGPSLRSDPPAHLDDPHGGPFDGAPDWLRLNLRRPAGISVALAGPQPCLTSPSSDPVPTGWPLQP